MWLTMVFCARAVFSPGRRMMNNNFIERVHYCSVTLSRTDHYRHLPQRTGHYSVKGMGHCLGGYRHMSTIRSLNQTKQNNDTDGSIEENTGQLLELLVNELISSRTVPTIEEWDEIGSRPDLKKLVRNWNFRLFKHIAHRTPEASILYLVAESLYKYSVVKQGRTNLFLDSLFILASISHGGVEGLQRGMKLYDELMNTYGVIDGLTATTLVRALSQTHRWKECFQLIEMAKLGGPVQPQNYVHMIIAASRVGDRNTVQEMCAFINANNKTLGMTESNINSLLKHVQTLQEMETFFYVLEKLDYTVLRENLPAITNKISDLESSGTKWIAKEVTISTAQKGTCGECGTQLEKTPSISAEDFGKMRDMFLERAVIKEDVYLNSMPKELADFQTFIQNHSQFDVILDGLNIAYTGSGKNESSNAKGFRVLNAVKSFAVDKNMRVLIIGRNHMKSWTGIQKIRKLGTCYFTQDLSNDDPFLLYAAMCCGQDTLLVTRDYMRNHSFTLGPQMQAVFKQWQALRQIFPYSRRGHMAFQWPSPFARNIQKTPAGWHIPFEDERPTSQFIRSQSWLCLHQTSSQ